MTSAPQRILIISHSRMGDLVQTIPLIARLLHTEPSPAIDLMVDDHFAEMAKLIPGIRTVLSTDLQGLIDDVRAESTDVLTFRDRIASWLDPLVAQRYDRVINLSFHRRDAWLARYLGVPDTRGTVALDDGTILVSHPWFRYFAALHRFRAVNRFNLVDLYALGGSGPGVSHPIHLPVPPCELPPTAGPLRTDSSARHWIAVQVGASAPIKAWRPEAFGQTLALLSQQAPVGFVMVGVATEQPDIHEALAVYRAAGGRAPVCNLVGQTTLPQLLTLLRTTKLLVTNDTGTMHLAVAVQTPVITVSVGHVTCWETGPYGPGHLVLAPVFPCSPCSFATVCPHQTCKDQLLPEHVAQICLAHLGLSAPPSWLTGMQVLRSDWDADGLTTYRAWLGPPSSPADWYGTFWRRLWYTDLTGTPSQVAPPPGPPPRLEDGQDPLSVLTGFQRQLQALEQTAVQLATRTRIPHLDLSLIRSHQDQISRLIPVLLQRYGTTWITAPLVHRLAQDRRHLDAVGLQALAQQQATVFHRVARQTAHAVRELRSTLATQTSVPLLTPITT